MGNPAHHFFNLTLFFWMFQIPINKLISIFMMHFSIMHSSGNTCSETRWKFLKKKIASHYIYSDVPKIFMIFILELGHQTVRLKAESNMNHFKDAMENRVTCSPHQQGHPIAQSLWHQQVLAELWQVLTAYSHERLNLKCM